MPFYGSKPPKLSSSLKVRMSFFTGNGLSVELEGYVIIGWDENASEQEQLELMASSIKSQIPIPMQVAGTNMAVTSLAPYDNPFLNDPFAKIKG